MFKAPNQYRVVTGQGATTPASGNSGSFYIPLRKKALGFMREITYGFLQVVASEHNGTWEHISVCVVHIDKKRLVERTPTWEEMTLAKDTFWDKTDECIQFHPPEDEYVNVHKYVLHIWRQIAPYRSLSNPRP